MKSMGINITPSYVSYAVVDKDDKEKLIHESGILYFSPAENPKTGESLQTPRANKRRTRLLIRREKRRIVNLLKAFKKIGHVTNPCSTIKQQVWNFRKKGLDELLCIEEFAAIVFHMTKMRGYKSNRLETTKVNEKGEILLTISATKDKIQASGARTYGEFMYSKRQKRNNNGEYVYFPEREQIEAEFDMICAKQIEFDNKFLNEEFIKKIRHHLFFQRPLKSCDHLIGKCSIYKEEKRAHKDSFTANIFNLLQKINNLQVFKYKPKHERFAITEDHMRNIVMNVFKFKKVTFKTIRKICGIPDEFRINLEEDNTDKEFFSFKSFHTLFPVFSNLKNFPFNLVKTDPYEFLDNQKAIDFYDDLIAGLAVYFEEEEVVEHIRSVFEKYDVSNFLTFENDDLNKVYIKHVMDIVSFSQVTNLSKKVMNFFITHFQNGSTYRDVYEQYFLVDNSLTLLKKLPKFEPINNPVVNRASAEARKVINALIAKHKIEDIFISSSKELGKSMKDRRKLSIRSKINERVKLDLITRFEALGITNITDNLIEKGKLWIQQNERCLFSSKYISFAHLLNSKVSITHIIPLSRSYDNSMDNKALVYTDLIALKQKKTLAQLSHTDVNLKKEYQENIQRLYDDKKLRSRKVERLLAEEFDEEEMKTRHLTDGRYINKRVHNHIATHLFPANHVHGIPRQIIHTLKEFWKLNRMAGVDSAKQPIESIMPVIDAIVMNFATKKIINDLTDQLHNEVENIQMDSVSFYYPNINIYDKITDALVNTNISRVISCKMSGELHGESIYKIQPSVRERYKENEAFTLSKEESQFSKNRLIKRIPLEKLTLKLCDEIVSWNEGKDVELNREIRKRLELNGDDGKKAFAAPIILPTSKSLTPKHIKDVEVYLNNRSGVFKHKGVTLNGDLLRLDMFKYENKIYCSPLYAMDAIRKKLPNTIIFGDSTIELTQDFEFICSVYKNQKILLKKFDQKNNVTTIIKGFQSAYNRAGANFILKNAQKLTITHSKTKDKSVPEYFEELNVSFTNFDKIDAYKYEILGSKHLIIEKRQGFQNKK